MKSGASYVQPLPAYAVVVTSDGSTVLGTTWPPGNMNRLNRPGLIVGQFSRWRHPRARGAPAHAHTRTPERWCKNLRQTPRGREIIDMGVSNKSLWLAVAATIVVPSKARAPVQPTRATVAAKPAQRHARPPARPPPQTPSRGPSPRGSPYGELVAG